MSDFAMQPLFFTPNRVWRCYLGGSLLDEFTGQIPLGDNHQPEDWLASCVQAVNGPNSQGDDEGLSRILLPDGSPGPLLYDIIASDPTRFLGGEGSIGFLCKFLDSAVRLPIQCHPDRDLARKLFHSEHGKAESWLVLATREINGCSPYLLMGFRPGVNEADFRKAVAEQDIFAMENMLHRIPVKPGDVYFIPGRLPHAIGPGVFMLEVQEPSDWVVQPEATCAGWPLSYSDMWGPLESAVALSCFNYTGEEKDEVVNRLRRLPRQITANLGGCLHHLIGPETTDCFGVMSLHIYSRFICNIDSPYYLAVVTEGRGSISWGAESCMIKRGDAFFVPADLPALEFQVENELLKLYLCLPGSE